MALRRDPHALSAPFNVDPAYAVAELRPAPLGLSSFAPPTGGPCWLYLVGDLATHHFTRLRREAFAVCKNVYHPGAFCSVHPTLLAKRTWTLAARPARTTITLYCAGHATLKLNGHTFFTRAFPATPEPAEADLGPYLQLGPNELLVTVSSLGEPATLLLHGELLTTDAAWVVSSDMVQWGAPDALPATGYARFPHQEDLPTLPLVAQPLGDGLYDFGVQTFGHLCLQTVGAGALTLRVGESLPEAQAPEESAHEQLILPLSASGGTHTVAAPLALRYVQLRHPSTLQVTRVTLAAALYPVRYHGAFACADDTLTAIWMRAAYTLRLCMRWLVVDGLKRDRLPWGGDLYMSGLVNNYSFCASGLLPRSLLALYGAGPETMDVNHIVDYSLFWILALRDHLLHGGDLPFARRVLPLLARLLAALDARSDARGFLPTRPGDWVFVDWSTVDQRGVCACIQMLRIMALDAAADVYHALAEPARAAALRQQAGRQRRRCQRAFWSPARGAYVDNVADGQPGARVSRPTNIFAVLSGTARGPRRRQVMAQVLRNAAVPPVGTPYMRTFEGLALAQCGEGAALLALIRQDWGSMMAAGATTFWEGYDPAQRGAAQYAFYGRPFGKSLCHAWSAGPVYLLSQALSGARPLTPGWARFTLAPLHSGLDWLALAIPCPHGVIRLDFTADHCLVTVPPGATLVTPTGHDHPGPCRVAWPH